MCGKTASLRSAVFVLKTSFLPVQRGCFPVSLLHTGEAHRHFLIIMTKVLPQGYSAAFGVREVAFSPRQPNECVC